MTNNIEEALKGLHATLRWLPYGHPGEAGYRREDGAGYVLPDNDGRWWVSWAHPMRGGAPGWHHHAFGTYASAQAGAFAFDTVYELERYAGNTDRCKEARKMEPAQP